MLTASRPSASLRAGPTTRWRRLSAGRAGPPLLLTGFDGNERSCPELRAGRPANYMLFANEHRTSTY